MWRTEETRFATGRPLDCLITQLYLRICMQIGIVLSLHEIQSLGHNWILIIVVAIYLFLFTIQNLDVLQVLFTYIYCTYLMKGNCISNCLLFSNKILAKVSFKIFRYNCLHQHCRPRCGYQKRL